MKNQEIKTNQKDKMRWVMFWVLIPLFVLITLLTILDLFFQIGFVSVEERRTLFTTFIVEIGVATFALFYALFGLKEFKNSSTYIKEVDKKMNKSKFNGFWIESFKRDINGIDVIYHSLFKIDIDAKNKKKQLEGFCYAKDNNQKWTVHAKWSAQLFEIIEDKDKSSDDSMFYAFKSTIYPNVFTGESDHKEDLGCGHMYFENNWKGKGWFISEFDARFGNITRFDFINALNIDQDIIWDNMLETENYLKKIESINAKLP